MPAVTWLHLSDWHQRGSKLEFDRRVVLDALLHDLQNRASVDPALKNIDFVFFTGDLAFKGAGEEYGAFQKELLDRVLAAVGVGKDGLFLIPGNHDIDRSVVEQYLPTALQKPFGSRSEADRWFDEGRARNTLLQPFDAYSDFVRAYGCRGFGAFGGSEIVTTSSGVPVGIAGCNSALMCGRIKSADGEVDDYGKLTVGEPQIYDTFRAIASAQVRIGLIHHPITWLQGWDQHAIAHRLAESCDFVLRGHEHSQGIQSLVGTDGDFVEIAAGASYDRRKTDGRYYNAYNFVRVEADTKRGTAYLRRWVDGDEAWSFDSRKRHPNGVYAFGGAPSKDPPAASPPASTTPSAPVAVPTDMDIRLLPRMIAAGMSRSEIASVWFSLFGTLMEDSVPAGSLDEVVIALVSTARKRNCIGHLLADLARNHPQVFTQ